MVFFVFFFVLSCLRGCILTDAAADPAAPVPRLSGERQRRPAPRQGRVGGGRVRRDARIVRRLTGGRRPARRTGARVARDCEPGVHLDHVRRFHGKLHAARRSLVRRDDPRRHRHRLADSHLLDGVHARGERLRVRALFLVPESFRGATGRSAQIPLYIWLPDAMEGPTPVSALIHAATMVTAGVYMIGRNAVLFEHAPQTLTIVAAIGTATALLAGTIGLVQNDIKRVLAYSTVSQLGYMFLAMGVGAYAAGIFHLYTHAFFKALLFLGSGAVIHALHGEQDLRRMGGLKRELPITYWTFLIGTLAIAGVPLLSGFFSKDEILFKTFTSSNPSRLLLWGIGMVTSLLTATYMFRLVFLAFHGERRSEVHASAHTEEEEPAAQT